MCPFVPRLKHIKILCAPLLCSYVPLCAKNSLCPAFVQKKYVPHPLLLRPRININFALSLKLIYYTLFIHILFMETCSGVMHIQNPNAKLKRIKIVVIVRLMTFITACHLDHAEKIFEQLNILNSNKINDYLECSFMFRYYSLT